MDVRPASPPLLRPALAGLAALLLAGLAPAQPPDDDGIARPDGARRIARVFDFEEPDNPDPVPAGWVRALDNPRAGVRRPGFPAHNEIAFDFTIGAPGGGEGTTSVLIPTHGGSAALRLSAGEVGVFVDADYAVTARVRTSGLRHARAFLSARFLDQGLRPFGPAARSLPAPPDTAGAWADITVELGRALPGAAWMQIDLELLQPEHYLPANPRLGAHEVRREDVSGRAWFDDVTVLQVPRVTLGTHPPGNIVVAPGRVEIDAVVRDLGGDHLTAELIVRDLDGAIADRTLAPADPGGKPLRWSPRLPAYGWYNAELTIVAAGRVVARTHTPIAWLAPDRGASRSERRRFGLVIDTAGPTADATVADVALRIGSGFVIIPAWDATLLSDQIAPHAAARRAGLERLLRGDQEITLCLPGAPPDVAAALAIDPAQMGELARLAPEKWSQPLSLMLDLFGQRLLRYQLGPTGTDAWFWDPDPGAGLRLYRDHLARIVPGPQVGVPWRADAEPAGPLFDPAAPPRGRADLVTLVIPAGFEPGEAMRTLGSTWTDPSAPELTCVLELPDPVLYGPRAGVTELARRALEFWAVFAEHQAPAIGARPARLAISQPWAAPTAPDGADVAPSPLLPAMRELIGRLDGRRVIGDFPAQPGVRCLILAARGPGGEMTRGGLAAWNVSATPDDALVDVTALGSSLRVFDVFGNELEGAIQSVAGRALVRLGETPVFVEGAEPYLALFASSVRIEPRFIRAVATEHDRHIVFRNPWPIRITGQLQVKEPDDDAARRRADWTFWPQGVIDFAAAPGEELRIPLTISFNASQVAGAKDLWIVAKVQGDRDYPPVRLRSPLEVGLEDLDLQVDVVMSPGLDGPDIIVIAAVTSKGDHTRALRLEAAAWGYPSQQLHISGLAPGQTVTRRFRFENGATALKGRRVVVGLSDQEEAERLNRAVVVP